MAAPSTAVVQAATEIDSKIDEFVSQLDSNEDRIRVRELLERYSALRTAISDAGTRAGGQFELFDIAGNRNGRTGTACLFRNNLGKLRRHADRTAIDLIRETIDRTGALTFKPALRSALSDFFLRHDDEASMSFLREEIAASSHQRSVPESPARVATAN